MKGHESLMRGFLPKFALMFSRWVASLVAPVWYRYPSKNLVVLGVLGSSGKTSMVNAIHQMLQVGGIRSGLVTSANFKIGNREWTTNKKLGAFGLNKRLKQMVKSDCKVAVLAVSSADIFFHRTRGIVFDILVFANQSSEQKAYLLKLEQKLFARLGQSPRKKIAFPTSCLSKKTLVANLDDMNADSFLKFSADQKIGFSTKGAASLFAEETILAQEITQSREGIDFVVEAGNDRARVHSMLLGVANVHNLLAAATIGRLSNFSIESIVKALEGFGGVAGRMERIPSKKGYNVVIDCATTPDALRLLYSALRSLYNGKIIAVFGASGERGQTKRAPMGQIVAGYADYAIIANENPYGEDPHEIARDIAEGFKENDKVEGKDFEVIINREHAIEKALLMATGENDVVVITGKGSEVGMNIGGKIIPFNDRETVLKYLK